MLDVIGESDTSAEVRAANRLAELIKRSLSPDEAQTSRIIIKPSLKIFRDPDVKDIDILLIAHFPRMLTRTVELTINDVVRSVTVRFSSLIACLEVKQHSSEDRVKLIGSTLWVSNRGKWKDASEQSFKQLHAARTYLKPFYGEKGYAKVRNRIWLVSLLSAQLTDAQHADDLLFKDSSFDDLLSGIAIEALFEDLSHLAAKRARDAKIKDYDDSDFIEPSDVPRAFTYYAGRGLTEQTFTAMRHSLSRRLVPTRLDRRKLEQIASTRMTYPALDLVGKEKVIVRGYGGAGKTVVLLRAAVRRYNEGDRVLLLTYNQALTSDLLRQLMLSGIGQGALDQSILPNTLHKFFSNWLIELGLANDGEINGKWFDREYKNCLMLAVQGVRDGEITRKTLDECIDKYPNRFDFDLIFIDEAQDWLDAERDFLYEVYGREHLLVAFGRDQLVRQSTACSWEERLKPRSAKVELRRCLRLTPNLAAFVTEFAKQMGLDDFELESDPAMSGGKVIIARGALSKHADLLDELCAENASAGNENIDMLFCVPRQQARFLDSHDGSTRTQLPSQMADWLEKRGKSTYDAVQKKVRDAPPRTNEDIRIVQYDSCRGLEGWITVLDNFDTFYDNKRRDYLRMYSEGLVELTLNPDDAATLYAIRWSLIPLTRAINTIVITLDNLGSKVGKAVMVAAKMSADFTDLRDIDPGHAD